MELQVSGKNSLKGIFEMNFTHKIDIFTGRLALGLGLGPGRVLKS